MENAGSRVVLVLCVSALVTSLVAGPATAATTDRTVPRLPKLTAEPIPGTPVISVSVDRLTPNDRIELSLPRGLGEANALEREWIRSQDAPDRTTELWTFSGTSSSSTALTLDMFGLESGERGLLSIFSTDPETGDELQAHWWLVAEGREAGLLPAGAARIEKMVRLTLAPGAPGAWKDIPRDRAGRLLLRLTDPRLAHVLPRTIRQEPFLKAQSISAETVGGGR